MSRSSRYYSPSRPSRATSPRSAHRATSPVRRPELVRPIVSPELEKEKEAHGMTRPQLKEMLYAKYPGIILSENGYPYLKSELIDIYMGRKAPRIRG